MLNKIIVALYIVCGVVIAEPLRTISSSNNIVQVYPENVGYEVVQVTSPDLPTIFETLCSLIGYKASALTIAVSVIEWVVSNITVILIGAVTALGFCKITGKCCLNYEQYIPVSQLQGLVTPENIETAEKFLVTAVEKYAEKKKRSA